MIPFIATGLTWFRAFKGPCLILALSGLVVGGVAGYRLASSIASGRVARAELALSNFRAELATATAAAEAIGADRQRAAMAALQQRDTATSEAVAEIPTKVAAMLAPRFTQLRESLNAPTYDCLRVPMPDDALGLLQRPGGIATPNR